MVPETRDVKMENMWSQPLRIHNSLDRACCTHEEAHTHTHTQNAEMLLQISAGYSRSIESLVDRRLPREVHELSPQRGESDMRNGTAHLRSYKELSTAGTQEKGWRRGETE